MSRRTFARVGHALRAARASRAVVRIACAVACCPCASLSAQSLDLGQYAHTAWRVRDGAPGAVRDLAQGADGVLWIASERGLFRFDGVRFERFEPPPGQTLLPHAPHVLLALPDTSLWIGHFTAGVSVFHRGRIVTYGTQDGLPGGAVTAIARDSGGTMWAATSRGLARLVGGRWEAIDTAAGYPGGYTEPVLVDRSGSVWAVAGDGIYVLPRGAARFEKREPTGAGRRDGELESGGGAGRLGLGRPPVVRRVPPGGRPRGPTATPHARLRRYRHLLPDLVPRQSRGGDRHLGPARPSVALSPRRAARPGRRRPFRPGRSPSRSPALRA